MGMDKSGTYSAPFNQTTKMTGWVERSGYPGTVITNNELVVNADGNITVYLFGDRSAYANTGDQFHIYKNGSTVANTGNLSFNADGSCQWTGAVLAGDTFAFYVKNASAFQNFTMQTGSYLYYTVNS